MMQVFWYHRYVICYVIMLQCALAAAQCIVIDPVCLWMSVFVGVWLCYHDNWKLCASIDTKLGL